jgi:hypothetical protein
METAIALIVGFALGYGVREWVSRRRREAERRRRVRANFVGYQHSPIVRKRNQTLIEQRIDVRGKQEPVCGVKALLVRAYCPWFNVRSTKDSRYSAARNSTYVAPTPSNVGTKPSLALARIYKSLSCGLILHPLFDLLHISDLLLER